MTQYTFSWITGILFIIISAIHLVRSIIGWDIVFNGWVLPIGVSVVFFIVTAFLAYTAFNIQANTTDTK
ncbi:MAG: hypothetical protein MUD00_00015 [Candidatus Pacebacteria bacterium]|jgi:hypothetical protein|nr:hypothetical protein [Candidatus Paceibacterota bacterium]